MDNEQSLIARMKRIPHFSKLGVRDLANIIHSGRIRKYKEGDILHHEGLRCSGLFVLLTGEVTLEKVGPEGHNYIMVVLTSVTMLNEVAVLDRGLNPATAVVQSPSRIWKTDCESFHQLMDQYPQIAVGLLPILAQRNRLLVSLYEDLSFLPVRARAAKLLLDLSRGGKQPVPRGSHPIQQLSARISTGPEVLSRAMRSLEKQGYIEYDRSQITILNPGALTRIAHLPSAS